MNRNLTATILIALAIGVYFTLTSGMIDDAMAVKKVNDQFASALDNAAQLVSVRDELIAKYKNISAEDRDRLDKMIPGSVDNIRLIIDLTNRALLHGFTAQGIKASVPSGLGQGFAAKTPGATGPVNLSATPGMVSEPTLDKVNVSFSVTAGYDQFLAFLKDLEADLRIMDLTSLKISANTAGTYDFDVQLQTYWLRQ